MRRLLPETRTLLRAAKENGYALSVKLFRFDATDPPFDLLPLAARRALDLAGLHLGLEAFRTLSLEDRRELTELGSLDTPDLERVRVLSARGTPRATPCAVIPDPAGESPPASLLEHLAPRALAPEVWRKLSPLERSVLVKLAGKRSAERLAAAYEEIVEPILLSTHLRPGGGVHMVDVSHKDISRRRATTEAIVTVSTATFERLVKNDLPKGDVLGVARVAGIMATKKTGELIPLCHPIGLDHVDLDLVLDRAHSRIVIRCTTDTIARTGVEMEAMTGVTIAALTLYDMLKSLDRGITLGPIRLLHKSGGRSGNFEAEAVDGQGGEPQ